VIPLPSVSSAGTSKDGVFVECHLINSTKDLVKGPTRGFFAECQYSGHSAKSPLPLPVAVTTTFLLSAR
jgi:hypothetical protein